MSERTFTLQTPMQHGKDVKNWQKTLNREMRTWDVDQRIDPDGDFGPLTRDLTASVCHGLGLTAAMNGGVTPALRMKIRNKDLTAKELARYHSPERQAWREAFRARHVHKDVATPVAKILSHAWGYHPGVHDGVDLICKDDAPIFAICRAKVIRVSAGAWWGLGAHPSHGHPVSDGDGIIVLRSMTDDGPFKKGLAFCYGHAEKASV